jgi:hypothetical protein
MIINEYFLFEAPKLQKPTILGNVPQALSNNKNHFKICKVTSQDFIESKVNRFIKTRFQVKFEADCFEYR